MKRVHFIGNGYESIKQVLIKAETYGEAITKAIEEYNRNNWEFKYSEIYVDKYEF